MIAFCGCSLLASALFAKLLACSAWNWCSAASPLFSSFDTSNFSAPPSSSRLCTCLASSSMMMMSACAPEPFTGKAAAVFAGVVAAVGLAGAEMRFLIALLELVAVVVVVVAVAVAVKRRLAVVVVGARLTRLLSVGFLAGAAGLADAEAVVVRLIAGDEAADLVAVVRRGAGLCARGREYVVSVRRGAMDVGWKYCAARFCLPL